MSCGSLQVRSICAMSLLTMLWLLLMGCGGGSTETPEEETTATENTVASQSGCDGKDKIAFNFYADPRGPSKDEDHGIYVMDADGLNVTTIPNTVGYSTPTFSPDGETIAAARYEDSLRTTDI